MAEESPARWRCVDGNEAAALVAYLLSEVIAIYPITPASPMGEWADVWSAAGRPNLWGTVPEVVEMQSEGGAAGVLHGAALEGALATTFTASQGLLLMLPNMFKLAGELVPAVIHVAARTVATHALSIFGDHSDVMAARSTGFAMLASASVQDAHDLALVAHAAALEASVPFVHFFDGFRTSHEMAKIEILAERDIRAVVGDDLLLQQRQRALRSGAPILRGSSQNPDVFFQAREAANPFHDAVPAIVQTVMDRVAATTGRSYKTVEYDGDPDADRVVVLMGSGRGAALDAVDELRAAGERVGLVTVRLFRPFPADAFVAALPRTVRAVAVLDRTKEPGAPGEPLYHDVVAVLAEHGRHAVPVIGGRYGLASKEFTPAMVRAVFTELAVSSPRRHFTVGITDDVGGLSLPIIGDAMHADQARVRALLYGLGSDGSVGAAKSIVKIVGEHTDLFAQGYFVYDSKKAGATTVSHIRIDDQPIRATYQLARANFIGCHQFAFIDHLDVLGRAEDGATFLLDSPFAPDELWAHLPAPVQETILAKQLEVWCIDARGLARAAGLAGRVGTVMQACFFALAGLGDADRALEQLKATLARTYAKRGPDVIARNIALVDDSAANLRRVTVPDEVTSIISLRPAVPSDAPPFVRTVTAAMLRGQGDLLPVSAFVPGGAWPTGTARYEKRRLAEAIPIWDPELCIDCGKCTIVCPHAALRMKVYPPDAIGGAPGGFRSKPFRSREVPGLSLTIQVAPDDCTGCGVCVDVCPAFDKEHEGRRALNMEPVDEHRDVEAHTWEYFLGVHPADTTAFDPATVKGSQLREPLFEFSGACAGCGETPYLKLLTQLFGDRLVVANATGCSSIFGGNLPTTPWSVNAEGRGPAWANSLFEDNAEFGFGIGLAIERHSEEARRLLSELAPVVGDDLTRELLAASQASDADVFAQRARVAVLRERLAGCPAAGAARLASLADDLVRTSVWIVGGDGWAYDIGFGGLDHVLASGRNVNVLVLDTEVYSNTGGQASKATPRGAVARFASGGKRTAKKDLGRLAAAYDGVYVAQVALGANELQTVKAVLEADAWPGPSLVIAYATCVEHGIDMACSMTHQKDIVRSGHWALYRHRPGGGSVDTRAPTLPFDEFEASEERFARLLRNDPDGAAALLSAAEADARGRWRDAETSAAE
jgi:pyruvate-ferredoxin/flavodoxin oxidoreductase